MIIIMVLYRNIHYHYNEIMKLFSNFNLILIFIIIFIQICLIQLSYGVVPKITRLNVQCDRTGIKVQVDFDVPFNGIIFSKGHYSDLSCRSDHSSCDDFIDGLMNCFLMSNHYHDFIIKLQVVYAASHKLRVAIVENSLLHSNNDRH